MVAYLLGIKSRVEFLVQKQNKQTEIAGGSVRKKRLEKNKFLWVITSFCTLGTNEVDDFTNQWVRDFQVVEVCKVIWNSVPITKEFP